MENPIKMDDLGVPLFLETSNWKLNDFIESSTEARGFHDFSIPSHHGLHRFSQQPKFLCIDCQRANLCVLSAFFHTFQGESLKWKKLI